jgi:Tol biopolymer transport system component
MFTTEAFVAQPFNPGRSQFTGSPNIIADQELEPDRTFSRSAFSVSDNGVIAFQSTLDSPARLIWFDPSGNEIGPLSDSVFRDPSFSPDGRYLAVASDDAHNAKYCIRVFDLKRNVSRRLTEPGNASRPVWSPNGREITYAATQGKVSYLYQIPMDGSAPPRPLRSGTVMLPNHWSPDGHLIFRTTSSGLPSLEIYLASDGSVAPFESGAEAQFSPDGKWIAYIGQGGVAGGGSIVVRQFPGPASPIRISGPGGGAQPRWSRDGRHIYFMAPDRKLMSATFDPVHAVTGELQVVFQTRIIAPNLASFQYDVAPDGRFLINSFSSTNSSPLTVITDWQRSK